jgi:hypothetical protein
MATLNFKGKTFVQNYHLAVPYHQLVPKKDKSITDKVGLNDNAYLFQTKSPQRPTRPKKGGRDYGARPT